MRKLSSSKKDSKYGVLLPTQYTSEIGINLTLPLISATVSRVSDEIFNNDRGSFIYDGITDSYLCHLIINETDRKLTHPFLKTATDVWLVIDAHSIDITDFSEINCDSDERAVFLSKLAGVGIDI